MTEPLSDELEDFEPWYSDAGTSVWHGDCRELLPFFDPGWVDAVVCDPPYGLNFMNNGWDSFSGTRAEGLHGGTSDKGLLPGYGRGGETEGRIKFHQRSNANFQEWCTEWARECLRVLKPGGHLIAFGGTRTWHRMAVAIEDAGLEIRENLAWLYGSGFPKSQNVSKAIDKQAGATREVVAPPPYARGRAGQSYSETRRVSYDYDPQPITAPATDAAKKWDGWGTALKPAFEPIIVARKPFKGTVAANVLAHGTGALNIDACRVPGENPSIERRKGSTNHLSTESAKVSEAEGKLRSRSSPESFSADRPGEQLGRWPANVLLDQHAAAALDEQTVGVIHGAGHAREGSEAVVSESYEASSFQMGQDRKMPRYGDQGGASRFFPRFEQGVDAPFRYQAKAPTKERPTYVDANGQKIAHPTVKPLAIMSWLLALTCPVGGMVLDPFAGSGATLEAARALGIRSMGIELGAPYLPLIERRMARTPFKSKESGA